MTGQLKSLKAKLAWLVSVKIITRDVAVTLRGLHVPADSSAQQDQPIIYPWAQLQRYSYKNRVSWYPVDKAGNSLEEDGKALVLHTKPGRATKLAKRAHERALKRAWQQGELAITLKYDSPWETIFIACLSFGMLVYIASFAPEFVHVMYETLFTEPIDWFDIPLMMYCLLPLTIFMPGLVWAPVMMFQLFFRTRHFTGVRLDGQGAHLIPRKGNELSFAWSDLDKQRSRFWSALRLRSHDGQVIHLPAPKLHGRFVWLTIKRSLAPEKFHRRAPRPASHLQDALIVLAFSVISALFTMASIRNSDSVADLEPLGQIIAILVCFMAIFGLLFIAYIIYYVISSNKRIPEE